jgi:hypothetical protein
MKRSNKKILIFIALAGLGGLMVLGYILGQKEIKMEQIMERPVEMVSRISIENGENIINLDEATQMRSGIVTDTLRDQAVPASAIVWLEGKSWVYVQKDPNHFVRREVFPKRVVQPGDKIVIMGPQIFLSEEFRSQIKVGEEENK